MVWNNIISSTPIKTSPVIVWSEPVQAGLNAVDTRLREVTIAEDPILSAAILDLINAGGKRIRPALSLLSSSLFEVDFERAVNLAAGVEMLHTATLVHDDLIDGAMLRRGAATLNKNWSPTLTILAGDYLFAQAANFIAQTGSVRIMELFAQTLMVIIRGEIAQRNSKWQINRSEYFNRIYAKTAALFVLSTRSAAVLGDADEDSTTALAEFGKGIGMAFQIVDDVLDYSLQTDQLGKPSNFDLRQGLFTLPAIYFAEENPNHQQLNTVIRSKDPEHPAIHHLAEAVCRSNAMERSIEEAHQFVNTAKRNLVLFSNSSYAVSLISLANSVIDRQA